LGGEESLVLIALGDTLVGFTPDCDVPAGGGECPRVSGGGAEQSSGGFCQSRCVAPVDVSACPRSRLSDRSPDRSHLRPLGIPIPQQNGQLAGGEAEAGRGGGGPPVEAALGEAFLTVFILHLLRSDARGLLPSRFSGPPTDRRDGPSDCNA